MDTSLQTTIIFFILIFGILEFSVVIIPSMISRSKVRRSIRPVYAIPPILYQPVSSDHSARIRSWYFDRKSSRYSLPTLSSYPLTAGKPADAEYRGKGSQQSLDRQRPVIVHSEASKDWKAINNASWAVQQVNADRATEKARRKAERAIHDAEAEELAWMDEIAGIDQIFVRRT